MEASNGSKQETEIQWYIRLHYEQLASITSYFITLTYATAPRSYNYLRTTIKQDIIKFMKRLRKTEPLLKYYAASIVTGKQIGRAHV